MTFFNLSLILIKGQTIIKQLLRLLNYFFKLKKNSVERNNCNLIFVFRRESGSFKRREIFVDSYGSKSVRRTCYSL